jgi:hypothetical protein
LVFGTPQFSRIEGSVGIYDFDITTNQWISIFTFADTVGEDFRVAISDDGDLIAAGDIYGAVYVWKENAIDESWQPFGQPYEVDQTPFGDVGFFMEQPASNLLRVLLRCRGMGLP